MTVLEQIASKENLFRAWSLINKNAESHGMDQETIQVFKDNLFLRISDINSSIRRKAFKFSTYRGHVIYQRGKKPRPLLIPTVQDRVVQKAIANIISRRFIADFHPCSYGYVPGKGIPDAVEQILKLKDEGYFFVLEADIESFFDTVNKEKLFDMVMKKMSRDSSVKDLIRDSLACEIGNPDVFKMNQIPFMADKDIGIPQGGILSPLFANIYLTSFDKHMADNGFKLVRYADDYIVLCKSEKAASDAYVVSNDYLEHQLGLKLHPLHSPKTKISDFKLGFKFLGIQFGLHSVAPCSESVAHFKSKVKELTNYNKVRYLPDNLFKLWLIINGWGRHYKFCGDKDIEAIFDALDNFVQKRVDGMMSGLSFLHRGRPLSKQQLRTLKIPQLCEMLKS